MSFPEKKPNTHQIKETHNKFQSVDAGNLGHSWAKKVNREQEW